MSDMKAEVEARVETLLAPPRERALAVERANRAAALNAAAITVTGSQYGYIGDKESHVAQVLDVAERYAAWIRTGEDLADLPPVDF